MIKIKNILFPVDFSEASLKAGYQVMAFAKEFDARVTLLHVIELDIFEEMYGRSPDGFSDLDKRVREIAMAKMNEFSEKFQSKSSNPIEKEIQIGIPSENICQFVSEKAIDLVIMATHGRTGLPRFFLGSVTERVVRMSSKPVLTLRVMES